MRDSKLYLDDIRGAIKKIEKYTGKISLTSLKKNELVIDAVVRNLTVIGEAVKHLPVEIKNKYRDVEWKKVAGLRDILVHEYFGVDIEVLWNIIQEEIPRLRRQLKKR